MEKVRDLHGYSGLADFVLFNPSDQRVLIAMNADSGSGRLWFWDVASGRKLSVIGKEQTPAVTCGVFFPDGKQVLLGATDGKARLWDIASGKCVQQFPCHYISRSVALLPGLKQAMTDSTDDALRLWDIVTGDELVRVSRLEGEKGWIAITPEGLADGTPELLDRPVFRVGRGRTAQLFSLVPQELRQPGLLRAVLEGKRPRPANKVDNQPEERDGAQGPEER